MLLRNASVPKMLARPVITRSTLPLNTNPVIWLSIKYLTIIHPSFMTVTIVGLVNKSLSCCIFLKIFWKQNSLWFYKCRSVKSTLNVNSAKHWVITNKAFILSDSVWKMIDVCDFWWMRLETRYCCAQSERCYVNQLGRWGLSLFNTRKKTCFSARPENAKWCDPWKIKMFLPSTGCGLPSWYPFSITAGESTCWRRIRDFG